MAAAPIETLRGIPLFEELDDAELQSIADLMNEANVPAGATVTAEGGPGDGFFVIDRGEAEVTIEGRRQATLAAGDYFGEIALIDEGARSATITANGELVCYGLTYWEFRPLVQQNATIAWNLLQTLAKRLRTAQDDHPE